MDAFGGLEDNAPDSGLGFNGADTWGRTSELEPSAVDRLPETGTQASLIPNAYETTFDSPFAEAGEGIDTQVPDAVQKTTAATPRRRKQRLIVRVTKIEHSRSEIIVWFDVTTSLPRFGHQTYRDVRRTHHEMKRFVDHLASANPECFVPALPPPTNSYPTDSPEHDATLIETLQRWFDRVTRSPLLARDEEFLYFVESSFGYAPVVRIKPPATGWARKMIKQLAPPPDDNDELREFRPVAKVVYQYGQESHARLARVSRSRRDLSSAMHDLATKLEEAATTVYQSPVRDALAHGLSVSADCEARKAGVEQTTYGDTIELVANDAFIIKETLTNRHILMRDLAKAQEESRSKHRKATRLKGETQISPARVDEAITQLEDAAQLEKRITSMMRRVSENLVVEKGVALARMEADIVSQLRTLSLRSIEAERRTLAAWEQLRPEVRDADGHGGLSRLGRNHVATSPRRNRRSQTLFGDDWSGDRRIRAADLAPPPQAAEEVVDAKTAASLLAGTQI